MRRCWALGARRFLLEYLVGERNLAHNTQQSYRDALALLFPFLAGRKKRVVDRLTLEDLSPDTLKGFLDFLELLTDLSYTSADVR